MSRFFLAISFFLGLSQASAYGIPCSVAVMGVRLDGSAVEAVAAQLNTLLQKKKTGYKADVVLSPGKASLYDYFMILQHNGSHIAYSVNYTLLDQVIAENSVVDDSRVTAPKAIISKIVRDFEMQALPKLQKCIK